MLDMSADHARQLLGLLGRALAIGILRLAEQDEFLSVLGTI